MAHYAFIDDNNIVTEVIVGIDETETIEGLDTETWYGDFRKQKCLRTSYNGKIRGKFAGVGDTYDPINDIFVSAANNQPFFDVKETTHEATPE
jgi:hypothetical protein